MSGVTSTLLYCHDTYGLGHLRRTLLLAHHLRSRWPTVSTMSAWIRRTISFGVAAGTRMPTHERKSNPGKPDSLIVGTAGNAG